MTDRLKSVIRAHSRSWVSELSPGTPLLFSVDQWPGYSCHGAAVSSVCFLLWDTESGFIPSSAFGLKFWPSVQVS